MRAITDDEVPVSAWSSSPRNGAGHDRTRDHARYPARFYRAGRKPPLVAVDLLLGRDRVATSQLIKQPDVLMLHHLVPDLVEPGSLGPNLDCYDPRLPGAWDGLQLRFCCLGPRCGWTSPMTGPRYRPTPRSRQRRPGRRHAW